MSELINIALPEATIQTIGRIADHSGTRPVDLGRPSSFLSGLQLGIGLGWVSILDPVSVPQVLEIPERWKLVAYLCLGYAEDDKDHPELEREGWAERQPLAGVLVQR